MHHTATTTSGRAAAVAALVLLAACGGAGEPARQCAADADCGAPGDAYCRAGTCVANGAPAASVEPPPGPFLTNTVYRFGASATDPEGEPVTVAWTVARATGDCPGDADAVAGGAPAADVVFWCAGTYDVVATASDPWGHRGTARATVTVGQATGAPTVTAAASLAVDHACAGDPLRCDAVAGDGSKAFQLGANGTGGALTFQWIALPPARAAAAVAAFSPSASVVNPTVSIRSDGTPLAGTWRMRVRARNTAGLVAQDFQAVEVGNRPPAIATASFSADHAYDGIAYVVATTLSPELSDPDGDPVSASFALVESAANACQNALEPSSATTALLTLSCRDAAQLVGGVERAIEVVADDRNGGVAAGLVPFTALDRPPGLTLAGGGAIPSIWAVPHGVGPCASVTVPGMETCFLATDAPALAAVDPDGDPLPAFDLAVSKDPAIVHAYGRVWRDGAGAAHYEFGAPVDLPEEFRAASGESGFSVRASVVDPFGAETARSFALLVENRPPAIAIAQALATPHHYDLLLGKYVAALVVADVVDPDGDPVAVAPATGDALCTLTDPAGPPVRLECELPYAPGTPLPLPALATAHAVQIAATDGWESAGASATASVGNTPPDPGAPVSVDSCDCVCTDWDYKGMCIEHLWTAGGTRSAVVPFSDADGDPALVDGAIVCLPPGCSLAIDFTARGSVVSVPVSDGVASTAVTVTATCSKAGQLCN